MRSGEPELTLAELADRQTKAIDSLRAACDVGFKASERFKNEEGFDPIRADPRVVALMREK